MKTCIAFIVVLFSSLSYAAEESGIEFDCSQVVQSAVSVVELRDVIENGVAGCEVGMTKLMKEQNPNQCKDQAQKDIAELFEVWSAQYVGSVVKCSWAVYDVFETPYGSIAACYVRQLDRSELKRLLCLIYDEGRRDYLLTLKRGEIKYLQEKIKFWEGIVYPECRS